MAEPNQQKADYGYRVPGWLRAEAGLGRCSPVARQPARTTYGLGIESIERLWLNGATTLTADITGLSSATFTEVDSTVLAWDVWFSGRRPVDLEFQCLANYVTGGGYVLLGFMLDGAEVTGNTFSSWYRDTTGWETARGSFPVENPVGGRHRLALGYKATAGSLTISSGMTVVVKAREV